MNVLLTISTPLVNAGVPSVIMKIVSSLNEIINFDIVVVGKEEGYYDKAFESYGGRIFRLPKYDSRKERVKYSFRAIQYIYEISKIIKENGPYDLIHCNDGIGAGSSILASMSHKNTKVMVHSHGTYSRYSSRNPILQFHNKLYLWLIRNSNIVRLACSSTAGNTLFANNEYVNVLNPVDVAMYSSIEPDKSKNEINMLQIGYFCKNKNQMFSLRLLNAMRKSGIRVQLTLMGFIIDEDYYNELLLYIKVHDLAEIVKFVHHDTNKLELFSRTNVLLLPSYTEGLPLVLLEAQSANLKCVVSETVTNDSDVGLCEFVGLNDLKSWEKAVLDNRDSTLDKKKLDEFDSSQYIRRIRDLYYSICEESI